MEYTYPRPQELYKNTLFLMKETVDSEQFTAYKIPYNTKIGIQYLMITDLLLKDLIESGAVVLATKLGFFNDKEFYRIPSHIQLQLF